MRAVDTGVGVTVAVKQWDGHAFRDSLGREGGTGGTVEEGVVQRLGEVISAWDRAARLCAVANVPGIVKPYNDPFVADGPHQKVAAECRGSRPVGRDRTAYLPMVWAPGVPASWHYRDHPPTGLHELLPVFGAVARSLDILHTATAQRPAVVHGDVKLGNILVDVDPTAAPGLPLVTSVTLVDITTMSAVTPVDALPARLMGSSLYLPPESRRGESSVYGISSERFSFVLSVLAALWGEDILRVRLSQPDRFWVAIRAGLRTLRTPVETTARHIEGMLKPEHSERDRVKLEAWLYELVDPATTSSVTAFTLPERPARRAARRRSRFVSAALGLLLPLGGMGVFLESRSPPGHPKIAAPAGGARSDGETPSTTAVNLAVLREDAFTEQTSGWDRYDNERATVSYDGGEYRVLLKRLGVIAKAPWPALPGRIRVEVDATKVSSESGSFGLSCRFDPGTSNSGPRYSARIDIDGSYRIVRVNQDQTQRPLASANTGQVWGNRNHIAMDCIGGAEPGMPVIVRLFVNQGRAVAEVEDKIGLGTGYAGVELATGSDPVEVRFDNFVVRPL